MQGVQWTYQQLAIDLFDFHDSKVLLDQLRPRAALHDEYGQSEEQDAAILTDMHTACLATFANCLAETREKYPEQCMLAAAARSEAATRLSVLFPPELAQEDQRQSMAESIVSAMGRKVHDFDRQKEHQDWLSVAAVSSTVSADTDFSRGHERQDSINRLLEMSPIILADSAFMQDLLLDSARTSVDEAGHLTAGLAQIKTASLVPPHCWRLIAMSLHSDIWILDIQHWRLSCYSQHDGPVMVTARNNDSAHSSQQAKCWQEPGYHFRLGELPLPSVLLEEGHGCRFFLLEPSGKLVSTSLVPTSTRHSLESRNVALQRLGFKQESVAVGAKGKRVCSYGALRGCWCSNSCESAVNRSDSIQLLSSDTDVCCVCCGTCL